VLKKQYWKLFALFASISYPFLVHYLVVTGQYLLAGIYIVALLLLIAIQNFLQNNKGLALGLFFLGIVISTIVLYQAQFVIYLPPVLIPLALAIIFGRTLMGEQTAFITSIAQKIRRAHLAETEKNYTRVITYMWVLFFLFLAIESAVVAIIYNIQTWSYITNFLNYILVAIFAICEYLLRRIILRDLEHPSFIGFIKQLIQAQRSHS